MLLMTPEVEPRPNNAEAGPSSTAIDSLLNVSRWYWPMSRTPSMKKLSGIDKPRKFTESPCEPPSPALSVTPGTLRKASCTRVRFCSASSFLSTLMVLCEMSWDAWIAVPVTSMLCSLSSAAGAAESAWAWAEMKRGDGDAGGA